MKLDDKIQIKRVAYLLKGEQSTAFELAMLYYILATRKNSDDKITDACRKSAQWLQVAGVQISDHVKRLNPAELLDNIEHILVANKAMICQPDKAAGADALVHAIPIFNRGLGLAYTYNR